MTTAHLLSPARRRRDHRPQQAPVNAQLALWAVVAIGVVIFLRSSRK